MKDAFFSKATPPEIVDVEVAPGVVKTVAILPPPAETPRTWTVWNKPPAP